MFGETDEAYGVELREKARALGIGDRVDFRGFREDVWAELAGMDVVVHASITPEPFGQVIVEAMLAGVPVIASVGGGPGELLTNDVDGLLYPAGDVDALVEALQRLRGDASLRSRLSANARIRAQRFSPQAEASNVMSLYWRVLERPLGNGDGDRERHMHGHRRSEATAVLASRNRDYAKPCPAFQGAAAPGT